MSVSFLKSEIERKKKQIDQVKSQVAGGQDQQKKWIRRGDIEKEREKQYLKEQVSNL